MPPTAAELYRYPYSKAFLMNEHSATLLELLVLQGYLGAPVFLVRCAQEVEPPGWLR